jgi:hypothetical protein
VSHPSHGIQIFGLHRTIPAYLLLQDGGRFDLNVFEQGAVLRLVVPSTTGLCEA